MLKQFNGVNKAAKLAKKNYNLFAIRKSRFRNAELHRSTNASIPVFSGTPRRARGPLGRRPTNDHSNDNRMTAEGQ